MRALLALDVDVDVADHEGWRALTHAVRNARDPQKRLRADGASRASVGGADDDGGEGEGGVADDADDDADDADEHDDDDDDDDDDDQRGEGSRVSPAVRIKVIVDLLAAGAEVDTIDGDGRSALMLAAQLGHRAAAEVLLSAGADAALAGADGFSAIALAGRDLALQARRVLSSQTRPVCAPS